MEGGAPLHETLEASFPRGLMPEGLEATLKHKVRTRIRDFSYRVNFPEDEPWEFVVETFAIAAVDRLHRTFGDNPWFWVVAWPGVMGAAAADFFPQVSSGMERRLVAMDATASHLEALLLSRSLAESGPTDSVPAPAVLGLKAIGQSTLPALPNRGVSKSTLATAAQRSDGHALRKASRERLAAKEAWKPPELPSENLDISLLGLGSASADKVSGKDATGHSGEGSKKDDASIDLENKQPMCMQCCNGMARLTEIPESYGNSIVICDVCHDPCSAIAEPLVETPFWHCVICQLDLCKSCASSQQLHSQTAAFGGS